MAGITVRGPMPIVLETQSRIVLRHNAAAALYVAIGMGAAVVAILWFVPTRIKYVFAAFLALFAFLMALAGMWRDRVEIDLASRQWRRASGFVGSVSETRGALDDIPAVVMELERRAGSDDNPSTWNVSIKAPAWKNEVVLGAHPKEEAGYAALESWARKLKRDAVDRTGVAEVRTPWDALDRSVKDRSARGVDPDAALAATFGAAAATAAAPPRVTELPPAGSRIVVTRASGMRRLVLPPLGWNAGASFMSLFGLCFGAFGTFAALTGAHVITGIMVNGRMLDRPDWGFTAAGSFFAAIGYLIIVAMFVGSRARDYVEDARDRLVFGTTWLGMEWSVKRIPKHAIEGIDLSASPASSSRVRRLRSDPRPPLPASGPNDVRVRTDARVVRLARYLDETDQRWLRDTLETMARS